MSFVIHHGGGDGTYKSFSVIQNHGIPQLQKGRKVISTIRGFDSIRVIEAVLEIDIPDSASIEFVDIETVEGRRKMSRFWEWADSGAYIIIDEAQIIFPKGAKVSSYDYPEQTYHDEFGNPYTLSSQESAQKDDKPFGLIHAITQHRHWNWDVVLITPDINFLIPEIKQMTRVAYAHRRMGDLIPWRKHGWREIKHLPTETWKQSVNPPVQYNADKRIYKVYKSTKTGVHQDGGAESSLFKNPKIMGSLSLAFIAIVFMAWFLPSHIFGEGGTLDMSKASDNTLQVSNNSSYDHVRNSNERSLSRSKPVLAYQSTTSFDSETISIVGDLAGDMLFEIGKGDSSYQISSDELVASGLKVTIKSKCLAYLSSDDFSYKVTCPLHRRYYKDPKKQKKLDLTLNPFQASAGDS